MENKLLHIFARILKQFCQKKKERKNLPEKWWNKQELLFSLACLLHDCAHAPFSHTLENLYVLRKKKIKTKDPFGLKAGNIVAELDYSLLKECKDDSGFKLDFLKDGKSTLQYNGVGAPHEKMSAYSVIIKYKKAIKEIGKNFLEEDITETDIVFMVRMIIGCTYKNSDFEASMKNCIISMLNSSSIDVDGLDYIVRDAYMSGMDNFNIDYQRLLSSFVAIPIEVFENKKGENIDLDGIWLKGTKLKIDRFKAEAIIGKLIIDSLEEMDKDNIKGTDCKVSIARGTCSTKLDDEIQVKDVRSGVLLIEESCRLYESVFTGTIIQGRRVQSALHDSFLGNKPREFMLGYDKRGLSIIDSAIEARNHEYLWVYTHPKVLYNSHYLQHELLRDSTKYLCCSINNKQFGKKRLTLDCEKCEYFKKSRNKNLEDDFLLYIIGYDTYFKEGSKSSLASSICEKMEKRGFVFKQTCDDDLNALFKRIYIENAKLGNDLKSEKIDTEFKEYFSRRQKKPLWKSFVEYDNFLKICEGNSKAKGVIPRFCEDTVLKADTRENNYARPDPEQQKIFNEYGFADVIVIKSSVKTKELIPNDTFIKFQDQTLRLCDIFTKENRKAKMTKDFYYIFANGNEDRVLSPEELVDMVIKLDNGLKK